MITTKQKKADRSLTRALEVEAEGVGREQLRQARAERLVAAVRAKGSDADDPRDAAHEACHALEWRVTRKWTRDNIHAKRPRGSAAYGVRDEITARAVEALVCEKLGVEYDQDRYLLACILETARDGIALPSFDWLKEAVVRRMTQNYVHDLTKRVLALADEV